MNKDLEIIRQIGVHLAHYMRNYKNDWVGIFLQGSQNYGLDTPSSDVDTKIIVLPSFEDIVLNRQPISTTSILPNNEHCDVKDIRLMFDCFKKQNINFLEILFTKYFIINPKYCNLFMPVIKNREAIARYNNYAAIHCILGTVNEKHKGLRKPHPSVQHLIDQYGYDAKQLHHMERLLEFYYRYLNGESYESCLVSKRRDDLIPIKQYGLPLDAAVQRADDIIRKLEESVALYRENHKLIVNADVDILLNSVLRDIMSLNIRSELGCV